MVITNNSNLSFNGGLPTLAKNITNPKYINKLEKLSAKYAARENRATISRLVKEFSTHEGNIAKNKIAKGATGVGLGAGLFGFIKNSSLSGILPTISLKGITLKGIGSGISSAGHSIVTTKVSLASIGSGIGSAFKAISLPELSSIPKFFTTANLTINPIAIGSAIATGAINSYDRFIHKAAVKNTKYLVKNLMEKGISKEEDLAYGVKKYLFKKGSLIRSKLFATFRKNKVNELANLKEINQNGFLHNTFEAIKNKFSA